MNLTSDGTLKPLEKNGGIMSGGLYENEILKYFNNISRSLRIFSWILFHLTFFSNSEASTQIWRVRSQKELLEGTPEGTAISSEGILSLSPLLDTLYETGELYLWSLVSDGKYLYAGSGNNGKIFRIGQEGRGEVLSHLEGEVEILSLAIDPKGFLYSGTGPGGNIYRISAKGEKTLFSDTEETYIWSLLFHSNGLLYGGTGEHGKILEFSKEGKGRVLYDSEENHILSLLIHGEKIYAGTSSSGLLFEINRKGEGRVLYDSPLEEIRSILRDEEGNLWIGATTRKEEGGEFSIYRISEERDEVDEVVFLPHLLLSLTFDLQGNLLAGTGDGSLLEVNRKGEWRLLLKVPASQILHLLRMKNQIFLGTGNIGNIYRVREHFRKEGTYLSKVHDAAALSRWGVLQVEWEQISGTKILLETRSGNTEKIDGTWSPWTSVKSKGDSESGRFSFQGLIESPPARFLQWKATLSTQNPDHSPLLKEVSIAYLQRNFPPKILSITLYPKGVGVGNLEGQTKRTPISNRKRDELKRLGIEIPPTAFQLEKGFQSIGWESEDENGDSLSYSLFFRGVEEKNWKVLVEKVAEESYIFDTSTIPDGLYLFRVVAWDTPDNPESHALSGEKESEILTIDNTPPKVENIKAKSHSMGRYTITFEVEDETSLLKGCSYAMNGQEWKPLYPSDALFDTSKESFKIETQGLPKGEHIVMIKAEDSLDNIGAGKILLEE